jgi:hypothetical protein
VEISLGQNQPYSIDDRADAIAIALSEPDAQGVSWQLDIYAQTDVGKTFVGTILTVARTNSLFGSRVVGYAVCPGARGWTIEATGPQPLVSAEVSADLKATVVNPAPSGLGLGVYRPRRAPLILGGPLAAFRFDYVAPIAMLSIQGSNESAAQLWLMLFDAIALPANGTQPYNGLAFNLAANQSFTNLFPDGGLFFFNGFVWAASSTANTLTFAAGGVCRIVDYAVW